MPESIDPPSTLEGLFLTLMGSLLKLLFAFVGVIAIVGFLVYAGYQIGFQVGRVTTAKESPPHDLHNANAALLITKRIIPQSLLPELFVEELDSPKAAAPPPVQLSPDSLQQIVNAVSKTMEAYKPKGDDTRDLRPPNSASAQGEMVTVPPLLLHPYEP